MSLFNMFTAFDDDPFFSTASDHMRQMESMMNNFMDPFSFRPSIMDGRQRNSRHRHANQLMPFDNFSGNMFSLGRMTDIFDNFNGMAANPNCHTYTSSSVMTYSNVGDGAPKVYEASTSTHSVPGGVRETKKSVRDSESGIAKMSIGHHLGDKAHIIERSHNVRTGDEDENQELINLDEEEASSFNQEWEQKVRNYSRADRLSEGHRRPLAITGSSYDHDRQGNTRKRDANEELTRSSKNKKKSDSRQRRSGSKSKY